MMNIFSKKLNHVKFFLIAIVLLMLLTPAGASALAESECLYASGYAAGFTITPKGAYVIGVSEVVTMGGVVSPGKDAGIVEGDVILSIGGKEVNTFDDIEKALNSVDSSTILVTIKRDNNIVIKEITPCADLSGQRRLGLLIREKISGIGTITFVKENGKFMALGHPICGDNGSRVELVEGNLFECNIFDVIKGERGCAGELRGMFINECAIGCVADNLSVGIQGEISAKDKLSKLVKVEVGDAKIGHATILSTIDGGLPKEYSIMIIKIDSNERNNRNYVVKVTDKALIEKAGGIVQGMSGSPILQDGKIVGAITHVFVNDPTRGFGIDIDKMLNHE